MKDPACHNEDPTQPNKYKKEKGENRRKRESPAPSNFFFFALLNFFRLFFFFLTMEYYPKQFLNSTSQTPVGSHPCPAPCLLIFRFLERVACVCSWVVLSACFWPIEAWWPLSLISWSQFELAVFWHFENPYVCHGDWHHETRGSWSPPPLFLASGFCSNGWGDAQSRVSSLQC